ncbi:MAG: xanthine dehydrogenase family protein subunit M, partial [Rhizobiaceae bacterium]
MNRFDYVRPTSIDEAIRALAETPAAKIIAGGTNLVDLMKYDVMAPDTIVDINELDLKEFVRETDGGYRIGA